MKLKKTLTALLMAVSLMCVSVAQAGTTTFKGVSVDYGSASTNWVSGELVLTYKDGSQLKIMDGAVNADILVVGGGGGGGRSNSTSSYYGSGNGGWVLAIDNQTLPGGSYEIAVGAGGSGLRATASRGLPAENLR